MPETTDPQAEPNPTESPEGDPAAAEAAYWEKMGKLMDERISGTIDKKLKEFFKGREGSRSEKGRTTIPSLLADFMYGPTKQR